MKRVWMALAGGLLAGIALLAWGWFLWNRAGPVPADPAAAPAVQVRIESGDSWGAAAARLHQVGLLADPAVLRLGARLTGRDRDLRAGLYELPRGLSPRMLLEALAQGPTVQVRVTLPEGWDARQMSLDVAQALGLSAEAFLAAADSLAAVRFREGRVPGGGPDPAAYDSLLAAESARAGRPFHRCEGYLAPDTYLFAEGTGPVEVAAHLIDTQLGRLAELLDQSGQAHRLPQGGHRLLTLASIVEAETRLQAERPLVAAVYANRLREGWKLEADPTVAFALDRKGQRLYHRHLEVDSAFNTYRRSGLPPGPIGNPGLAALAAAARPDSLCRAMFFVADGIGGHVFSLTAKEHREAAERFRRVRAAARREQGGG